MSTGPSGVTVAIGADTEKLKTAFQTAASTVGKATEEIGKKLGGIGGAAQKAEKETADASQKIGKSLKDVEQAAEKASKATADAGGKMGSSFSGAAGAMGGSIGGLVMKIGGLIAAYASLQAILGGFSANLQLIDDTDAIAQNMSISTERASAYREMLQGLDLSMEEFNGATGKVGATLAKNEKIFDTWGVKVRDSNGNLKSQEQVFMAVLKRVGEYEDGSDRAAAAQRLLGVDLDTANKMLAINEQNLKAGADAAAEFGTVVSDDMVKASDDYKAAMKDLDSALNGLKLAFFNGLIPAVTAFVDFISSNAPMALDILRSASMVVIQVFESLWDIGQFIFQQLRDVMIRMFGESGVEAINWSAVISTAMDVVKTAVVVAVGLFKFFAEVVKFSGEAIGIAVGGIIETFMGLATLNPSRIASGATTALAMIEERAKVARTNIAKDIAGTISSLQALGNASNISKGANPFTGVLASLNGIVGGSRPSRYDTSAGGAGGTRVTTENQKGGGGGGGGDDEASKLIKAQTELIKAELAAQLEALKEKNRQEKNELDEQLRDNEVSYREYYARITAMAKEESQVQIRIKEEEIAALEKLQKTAKNESDKVALQAQMVKLQSELNVLKLKEGEIDRESARALKDKLESVRKMKLDLMSELSQASGVMDVEAEFAALEERYSDMKERFAAEGDTEGSAALEKLLGYKRAQLQIGKFQQDFDLLQTNMKTKELELDAEAKRRGLTDDQLQRKKMDLQKEEIDLLIDIKQKQLEVAEAAYGANSAQVASLRQTIAELKVAKTETNEFAKGLNSTLAGSFNTLFQDIQDGTKSARDIFKDFVGSIIQGINQMVAQILSKRVMDAFSSLGGGGGGGAGGGAGGFISSIMGAVMGGRANGGFTAGNKPYMVGEDGPELFVPRTSGDIMNTRDLQQMMMNGGRRNAPVTVNINTPDPHAFRKTQVQTMAELSKTVTRANNRNN